MLSKHFQIFYLMCHPKKHIFRGKVCLSVIIRCAGGISSLSSTSSTTLKFAVMETEIMSPWVLVEGIFRCLLGLLGFLGQKHGLDVKQHTSLGDGDRVA